MQINADQQKSRVFPTLVQAFLFERMDNAESLEPPVS